MSTDPATAVPDLELGDEPYDSAEDDDFEVDGAEEDSELSASDADEDVAEPVKKKRKTGAKEQQPEEKELDSGDEATIKKAKAKKDKKGKKSKGKGGDDSDDDDDDDFDDDEEGGPGGFVRTRAMKMQMQEERKPLAKIDGATVDVDALWAKMNAPETETGPLQKEEKDEAPAEDGNAPVEKEKKTAQEPVEMIKIKRTYKFAGEMITEEKIVPKDSAEAKVFLAGGKNAEGVTDADIEDAANAKAALKLRRPLRKVSRFDPNPSGSIKKSWEKQPGVEAAGAENAKGPKINTVEKSRLDWAAYVDQAGIKDELNVHSKAKEGYMGRMDFLDRVGAKQDEDRRNARLKGM